MKKYNWLGGVAVTLAANARPASARGWRYVLSGTDDLRVRMTLHPDITVRTTPMYGWEIYTYRWPSPCKLAIYDKEIERLEVQSDLLNQIEGEYNG